MPTFYLKYRDTLPSLEVALKNPDGTAYNLTGASSVTLHIRMANSGIFSKAMTVDSATAGEVSYDFVAADWTDPTPLAIGTYTMEYEVIDASSKRLTFPNDGYDEIRIRDDIGQT